MKSLKVLGIIGIVLSVICFLYICCWSDSYEAAATAAGAGVISVMYLLAISIVAVVQSKHIQ